MAREMTTYRPNSVWDFMSEVEKAFDDIWKTPANGTAQKTIAALPDFAPAVDLHETSDSYMVSLDVPGISEKDIKIDIEKGRLTISGERRREDHMNDGLFKRFERSYGTFIRTFQLPQNVDDGKIQARMDNGVLEILIPKVEVAKTEKH